MKLKEKLVLGVNKTSGFSAIKHVKYNSSYFKGIFHVKYIF